MPATLEQKAGWHGVASGVIRRTRACCQIRRSPAPSLMAPWGPNTRHRLPRGLLPAFLPQVPPPSSVTRSPEGFLSCHAFHVLAPPGALEPIGCAWAGIRLQLSPLSTQQAGIINDSGTHQCKAWTRLMVSTASVLCRLAAVYLDQRLPLIFIRQADYLLQGLCREAAQN